MTRGVEIEDSIACVYIASEAAQLMLNMCMTPHCCSIVISNFKLETEMPEAVIVFQLPQHGFLMKPAHPSPPQIPHSSPTHF